MGLIHLPGSAPDSRWTHLNSANINRPVPSPRSLLSFTLPAPPSVIDAHHHLWRYSAIEYEWIDDRMAALRRDFLPAEFIDELTSASIDGAVTVQARQTL